MFLHLAQPIVRGGHRLFYRLSQKRLPRLNLPEGSEACTIKPISYSTRDIYWDSQSGIGREQLLEALVFEAKACHWSGDFHGGWVEWDVELIGDAWHHIHIRTATEELGWPRRFTRARCTATLTGTAWLSMFFVLSWITAGALTGSMWGSMIGLLALGLLMVSMSFSRLRCLKAATALLRRASLRAGLVRVREENWSGSGFEEDPGELIPAELVTESFAIGYQAPPATRIER